VRPLGRSHAACLDFDIFFDFALGAAAAIAKAKMDYRAFRRGAREVGGGFAIAAGMAILKAEARQMTDANPVLRNIADARFRLIEITDDSVIFRFFKEGREERSLALNLSPAMIAAKFFRHSIPGEAEVEYAINFIEDELMKDASLVNAGERLYVADRPLAEALRVPAGGAATLTREAVEEAFTRYALLSMGRSPVYDDIAMDRKKYAAVLIVREILHHLDFGAITLFDLAD
jgi:hypothetical protein